MLRADAGAAVTARIVQSTNSALAVAHEHYGVLPHLHGEIVPRARNFAIMPDEQPVPVPDLLQILTVIAGST